MKQTLYYDAEKQLRLVFSQRVIQYALAGNGVVEIVMELRIAEERGKEVIREEISSGAMQFTVTEDGEYPIQISKIREGNSNKYIYTATNNQKPTQRISVGIIPVYIKGNPMFESTTNTEKGYQYSMKGNIISELPKEYIAPTLQNTIARQLFTQAALPKGMTSQTNVHHRDKGMMEFKEFNYHFAQPIPELLPFAISFDIAPYQGMDSKDDILYDLTIDKIGNVRITVKGMSYLPEGRPESDRMTRNFGLPIEMNKLFNGQFMKEANFKIVSRGGDIPITIHYNGIGITTETKSLEAINFVNMKAGMKKNAISEANTNRLSAVLDNFIIQYTK